MKGEDWRLFRDAFGRAGVDAGAALGALRLVDLRNIIYHGDAFGRAGFNAFFTTGALFFVNLGYGHGFLRN